MLQVNSFFIFYQKQIQGRNEPALYTSSIPSVAEGNTDILGSFHHLTVYRNKLGFHRHISQGIFSDLSVYHRNGVAELLVLEELRCVRAELRCKYSVVRRGASAAEHMSRNDCPGFQTSH